MKQHINCSSFILTAAVAELQHKKEALNVLLTKQLEALTVICSVKRI
jgi:hypothetical protein